ncbi:MAG: hypothetical protein HY901_01220, partial [Deltaproteobacteria bacterium]|nr:hypothetical protein [Deltaproteobacteria bacterium]
VVGRATLPVTPEPPDTIDPNPGTTPKPVVVYDRTKDQTLYTYAPNWKGDFSVPGRGAGNVCIGREFSDNRDAINVLVNCNLMEKSFVENDIASATMVIGPKGSNDPSAFSEVPMSVATAPGYTSYSRGGGSYSVPEKKYLGACVDTNSLRGLNNGQDLAFYMRLQTRDGQTLWVNKDGKAFKNFEINAADITPRGDL